MDKKIETEQIVSYEENVVKVNQKTNEEKNVKENIEYPEIYIRPGDQIDLQSFKEDVQKYNIEGNDVIVTFKNGEILRFISMLLVGLENPDMEIKLKDKTVKFKEIATTFEPISKISENAVFTDKNVIVKNNIVIADKQSEVTDTAGNKEADDVMVEEMVNLKIAESAKQGDTSDVNVEEKIDTKDYDMPPPYHKTNIVEDFSSNDLSKASAQTEGIKPMLEFEIDFMHVYQDKVEKPDENTINVIGGGGTKYENAYPKDTPLAEQVKQTEQETLQYDYIYESDFASATIVADHQDLFTETMVSRIVEITPTMPPAFELKEFVVSGLPDGVTILNGEETDKGVWSIKRSPLEKDWDPKIPYDERLEGFYENLENKTIEIIFQYDRDIKQDFEMNVWGVTKYNASLVTDELREAGFEEPIETELEFDKWYGVNIKEINPDNLNSYTFNAFEGEEGGFYEKGFVLSTTLNDNEIFGIKGNNKITGGLTTDIIETYQGDDYIESGKGNDIIRAGAGDDYIDGGEHELEYEYAKEWVYGGKYPMLGDTIAFDNFRVDRKTPNDGVEVNLEEGYIKGEGNDTITGVENVIGSNYKDDITGNSDNNIILSGDYSDVIRGREGDDELYGESGNDIISGNEGNDFIYGGEGSDTIDFDEAKNGINIQLQTEEANELGKDEGKSWGEGEDYIYEIENIKGSKYNDLISGNKENNIIDGNEGTDTIDYSNMKSSPIEVDLESGYSIGDGMDILKNIENIIGTDHIFGHDKLTGSNEDNRIEGLSGNDVIKTLGGNDVALGGKGNDEIYSGTGNDVYDGGLEEDTINFSEAQTNIKVSILKEEVQDTNQGKDQFLNFENLIGSSFNDYIEGNFKQNTIDGGKGTDTLDYGYYKSGIEVNLSNTEIETETGMLEKYSVSKGNFVDSVKNIENIKTTKYDDYVVGSNFKNVIETFEGDDYIVNSSKNNTIDGGEGKDTIDYTNSQKAIVVDDINDNNTFEVKKGLETDTIKNIEHFKGTQFNDELTVNENSTKDYIFETGKGDDIVKGGSGSDTIYFGEGNDIVIGSKGRDIYDGEAGIDTIDYSKSTKDLEVDMKETKGTLKEEGQEKDRFINMENIKTGEGDDIVKGSEIGNKIETGAGDDIIFENFGANSVDGGEGSDTLDYSSLEDAKVSVNINSQIGQSIYDDGTNSIQTKIKNIENIIGTNYDDILTTNSKDNTIFGGEGDDYITLFEGDDVIDGGKEGLEKSGDTIDLSNNNRETIINLKNETTVQDTNIGNKILKNIENVIGTNYDDYITGNEKNNIIDGNFGVDTVDYSYSTKGINANISKISYTKDDLIICAERNKVDAELDQLLNIENIIGSDHDDLVISSNEDNNIETGSGDDTVVSSKGNDTIKMGTGNDTMSYERNTQSIKVEEYESNNTTVEKTELIKDKLYNVENITGSNYNDKITASKTINENNTISGKDGNDRIDGGAGDDRLLGGAGDDHISDNQGKNIIDGGTGDDTIDYSESTTGIHLNMDTKVGDNSIVKIINSNEEVEKDTIRNVENVIGTNYDDKIYTNEGNNKIDGGTGDDIIFDGYGINEVDGGTGKDTIDYSMMQGSIKIDLSKTINQTVFDDGINSIQTKYINIENVIGTDYVDTIRDSKVDNVITTGQGEDYIYVTTGNDTIDGGEQDDTIDFSLNTQAIKVDLSNEENTQDTNIGIKTITDIENVIGTGYNDYIVGNEENNKIDGKEGTDTIDYSYSSKAVTLNISKMDFLNKDFEILEYKGKTSIKEDEVKGIENVIGSEFNDRIVTSKEDNKIETGKGDDLIISSRGNDTIDGGVGNDTVSYEKNENAILVEDYESNNTVVDKNGVLKDKLFNVENITGSVLNDKITASKIVAEDNIIDGGAGDDIIDGGAGDDKLYGSEGDDHISDTIGKNYFNGGAGSDTIDYSKMEKGIDFRMNPQEETSLVKIKEIDGVLTVKDTVKDVENIIGTNYDDNIYTNEGNNKIETGKGDDIISEGFGSNVVDGGEGSDTLDYSQIEGNITIDISKTINQTIYDDGTNSIQTKYTNVENVIGTNYDDNITGNSSINEIKSGLGDDIIDGKEGDNRLFGQEGSDIINAGDGKNYVEDKFGNNTITLGHGGNEVRVEGGDNKITTGDGEDNIYLKNNTNEVSTGAGNDTVDGGSGTDIIEDGEGDDIVDGKEGNDMFIISDGTDTIQGGLGDDTINFKNYSTNLDIKINTENAQVVGTPGTKVFKSIENVIGGNKNDKIQGNFKINKIDGGSGSDTIDYSFVNTENYGVTINLSDNDYKLKDTGDTYKATSGYKEEVVDTLESIENAIGTNDNDLIIGNKSSNEIEASDGNDTIIGSDGNDIVDGGSGNDTIDYSDSSDSIYITNYESEVKENIIANGEQSDKVKNIENIISTDYDDTIKISGNDIVVNKIETGSGSDIVNSGGGNDIVDLGEGNDTFLISEGNNNIDGGKDEDLLDYSIVTKDVKISLVDDGGENITKIDNVDKDTIKNIENITTGTGNDNIVGNNKDNVIKTGTGDDTIGAQYGNLNIVEGGLGTDTYQFRTVEANTFLDLMDTNQQKVISKEGNNTFMIIKGIENIQGSENIDIYKGDSVDNKIEGFGGDDEIYGREGNDTLNGDEGNDFLSGDSGDDTLNGGTQDDVLKGGSGDDILNGGAGIDTADYTEATEDLNIDLSKTGKVFISDSQGSDTFNLIEGAKGGSGDDILTGTTTTNYLYGNDGDDTLLGYGGDDIIDGGAGIDFISFNFSDKNLTIRLDTLDWQDTNDGKVKLIGIENAEGGTGDDKIYGNASKNEIRSLGGNDTIYGSDGDDKLYAGTGDDILDYSLNEFGGVEIDINLTEYQVKEDGYSNKDDISGFETIQGSNFSDIYIGKDGYKDIFKGGDGNDTITISTGDGINMDELEGEGGDDTFIINTSTENQTKMIGGHNNQQNGDTVDMSNLGVNEAVKVELTEVNTEIKTIVGNKLLGVLNGIENIIGTQGNDDIKGNSEKNIIDGEGGDDILRLSKGGDDIYGGAGFDELNMETITNAADVDLQKNVIKDKTEGGEIGSGSKVYEIEKIYGTSYSDIYQLNEEKNEVDGNGGINTLTYIDYTYEIKVDLSKTDYQIVGTTINGNIDEDKLSNIHNVIGSNQKDILIGSDATNELFGGMSNDVLNGGAGNDKLYGESGNDTIQYDLGSDIINGGEGSDTLDFSNYTLNDSGIFNLKTNETIIDGETDTTSFIENIIGTKNNDTIVGDNTNNTLIGGLGEDTIDYSTATNGVKVNLNIKTQQDTKEGIDTIKEIENIKGSNYKDILEGDSEVNIIEGGEENDKIINSAGADELYGNTGNDIFEMGTYTNSINTIDGGENGVMDNGIIGDTVDYSNATNAIEVNLNTSNMVDVKIDGTIVDRIKNVENVIGTDFNDNITGDSEINIIKTGVGDDIIVGSEGNDTINGGEGSDTVDYSSNTVSKVDVSLINGISISPESNTDTLVSIENVIGTIANDTIEGNGQYNTIDGKGGVNTLTFNSYDYSIKIDLNDETKQIVYENGGNVDYYKISNMQNLIGTKYDDEVKAKNNESNNIDLGEGVDLFIGSEIDGENIIDGNNGSDTIDYSNYTHKVVGTLDNDTLTTLTVTGLTNQDDKVKNIENIILGSGDDEITGKLGSNKIEGRAGNDILKGGYGEDELLGGADNDILDGGLGNDKLDGGSGIDEINYSAESESLTLNMQVKDTEGWSTAQLNTQEDKIKDVENITGSMSDDEIIMDEKDNILDGFKGNDKLDGGLGDDIINGGLGDDIVYIRDILDGNDTIDGGADSVIGNTLSFEKITSQGVNIDLSTAVDVEGFISVNMSDGIATEVDKIKGFKNLIGTSKNDNFIGDSGDNNIEGRNGDDTLNGGLGDDTINGGEGSDTISYSNTSEKNVVDLVLEIGKVGATEVDKLISIENVTTGSSNDQIFAKDNQSKNIFDGGDNIGDEINYSKYTTGVTVDLSKTTEQTISLNDKDIIRNIEYVVGTDFNDFITGSSVYNEISTGLGNDTIWGAGAGNDKIRTGEGDDIVYNSDGIDDINTGAGNDTIKISKIAEGGDNIDGSTLIDTIDYSEYSSNLNVVNVTLNGSSISTAQVKKIDGTNIVVNIKNIENVVGSAGNDNITGDDLVNKIEAGLGDDTIDGGAGNDTIYGEAGNDIIYGKEGKDTIDGGTGNDTIDGGEGKDTIDGGEGDDHIYYSSGDDIIVGGNNTNVGDIIDFTNSTLGVNLDLNTPDGVQQDLLNGSFITLSQIENVIGSKKDDVFKSNVNVSNNIDGGDSTTDDDTISYITLEVNDVTKDYLYSESISNITIYQNGVQGSAVDSLSRIENIIATNGNDTTNFLDSIDSIKIWGEGGNDTIRGGKKEDSLYGGAGDDIIEGGEGDDIIEGGAGQNTISYENAKTQVEVNLQLKTGIGSNTGNDTFKEIQNIIGSEYADTFIGDSGDNTINGGGDNDTIDYSTTGFGTAGINADLSTGIITDKDINSSTIKTDTVISIENVIGSEKDDIIKGNDKDNVLKGGADKDEIYASKGKDTLDGGDGNDEANFSEITDRSIDITLNMDGEQNVVYKDLTEEKNIITDIDTKIVKIENITGTINNDSITGDAKANILKGDAGDDILNGMAQNDTIDGGEGNDIIDGGEGSDSLKGDAGDDIFKYSKGNDKYDGGTNTNIGDTIDFRTADAGIKLDFSTAEGQEQTINIATGEKVTLTEMENTIGSLHNDTFISNITKSNTIDGSEGDDNISYESLEINGDPDNNRLVATSMTDIKIYQNGMVQPADSLISIESLTATNGNDEFNFEEVNYDLFLYGIDGNDKMIGGLKNDLLEGGEGNDTIDGGTGNDIIDGGTGNDTVSYQTSTTGAVINLTLQKAEVGADVDTLISIENVIGSNTGDVIIGNSGNNIIDGKEGIDTVDYSSILFSTNKGINADLSNEQIIDYSINTVIGTDTVISIENVVGSEKDDIIKGNDEDNELKGKEGNDEFKITKGNDIIDGGLNEDTMDFSEFTDKRIEIELKGNVNADLKIYKPDNTLDIGYKTEIKNIENITGTQLNDKIIGDGSGNILKGEAGNDTISGLSGIDTIDGGAGDDTLDGGTEADTIIGGAGQDTLLSGAGNDTFEGGEGDDTIDYSNALSKITVDLEGQNVSGNATNLDTFKEIEIIKGTKFDDVFNSGSNNNNNYSIEGGEGKDEYNITNTAIGNEIVNLGKDNDIFNIINVETSINGVEKTFDGGDNGIACGLGANGDTIDGSSITTKIIYDMNDVSYVNNDHSRLTINNIGNTESYNIYIKNIENIFLGTNDDIIYGDDKDSLIKGNEGKDIIEGGAGNDIIEGGSNIAGIENGDTVSYDYINSANSVNIDLSTGIAVVEVGADEDKVTEIENVIGSKNDDIIKGDQNDNKLEGKLGNDTIYGSLGNDTIYGNENTDEMSYDTLNSLYYIDTTGLADISLKKVLDDSEDYVQKLNTIEIVTGTQNDDIIYGNVNANTINGNKGNDKLSGLGGADIIAGDAGSDSFIFNIDENNNQFINIENDKLDGGDDSDTIDYSTFVETLTLTLNTSNYAEGIFTKTNLDTSIHEVKNIENVIGSQGKNIIIGDSENNTIIGNVEKDILKGGNGIDYIEGKEDEDKIYGGSGDDILDGGSGNDTIYGDDNNDTIYGGEGNDIIYGGTGVDEIDGGLGDDTINGGSGNDSIDGSSGNDIISGDAGDDIINGGLGINTLFFGNALSEIVINMAEKYSLINSVYTLDNISGTHFKTYSTNLIDQGEDYVENIRDIIGSFQKDTITTDAQNNYIKSGGGNDEVNITKGENLIVTESGEDIVNATTEIGLKNTIYLGIGNDVFIGQNIGGNYIDGEENSDTVDYNLITTNGLDVDLTNKENKTINVKENNNTQIVEMTEIKTSNQEGIQYSDYIRNVENIIATEQIDILKGDDNDNRFEGRGDNDIFIGRGGNDTLIGGEGIDRIKYDYVTNSNISIKVDLIEQTGTVDYNNPSGNITDKDSFETVENFTLGKGNDLIINDSYKYFYNNDIDGGEGIDTITHKTYEQKVVIDLQAGTITSDIDVTNTENDSIVNVENATGSRYGDEIKGSDEDNEIRGYDGDDKIYFSKGNDILMGEAHQDTFIHEGTVIENGIDRIDGGEGKEDKIDYSRINSSNYIIADMTSSENLVIGKDINNVDITEDYFKVLFYNTSDDLEVTNSKDNFIRVEELYGTEGNDTLIGNNENNKLFGAKGNDIIKGTSGENTLKGGDGDDKIYGGDGDDRIYGEIGNDIVYGSNGTDILYGGDGKDTLNYSTLEAGIINKIKISLGEGTGSGDDIGVDVFVGFEDVIGTNDNDTISGNTENNQIWGNDGDDIIAGSFELEETLNYGQGDDNYYGGKGEDTIYVGVGNDYIDGGEGIDTVNYSRVQLNTGITVDLSKDGIEQDMGAAGKDTLKSIEGIVGTVSNDYITGSSANNVIDGSGGNDILLGYQVDDIATVVSGTNYEIKLGTTSGDNTIRGGSGNDTIYVYEGNDIVVGGEHNDTLIIKSTKDTQINFLTNTFEIGNLNTVTNVFTQMYASEVYSMENITTQSGNDNIVGSLEKNIIKTGEGNDTVYVKDGENIVNTGTGNDYIVSGQSVDTIDGGEGNDTVDYVEVGESIYIDTRDITTDPNTTGNYNPITKELLVKLGAEGAAEFDKIKNIEIIKGTNLSDYLYVLNNKQDTIYGNAGDDMIFGSNDDKLYGDAGADTIEFKLASDKSGVLDGGTGVDDLIIMNDVNTEEIYANLNTNKVKLGVGGTESIISSIDNLTFKSTKDIVNEKAGVSNKILLGDNDDLLIIDTATSGGDILNGESGDDTIKLDYTSQTGITKVDYLNNKIVQYDVGNTEITSSVISNFETVIGSNFNDWLTTSTLVKNTFNAGAGNDKVEYNYSSEVKVGNVIDSMEGGNNNTLDLNDNINRYGDLFINNHTDFKTKIDVLNGKIYIDLNNNQSFETNEQVSTISGFETIQGMGVETIIDGNDTMKYNLGSGNDIIYINKGDDKIDTGVGADTIYIQDTGASNKSIQLNDGDDTIYIQDTFIKSGNTFGDIDTGTGANILNTENTSKDMILDINTTDSEKKDIKIDNEIRGTITKLEEVVTGSGSDTVTANSLEIRNIDLGSGNDTLRYSTTLNLELYISTNTIINKDDAAQKVNAVRIENFILGSGDDMVDTGANETAYNVKTGIGSDVVYYRGYKAIIDGEGGTDKIYIGYDESIPNNPIDAAEYLKIDSTGKGIVTNSSYNQIGGTFSNFEILEDYNGDNQLINYNYGGLMNINFGGGNDKIIINTAGENKFDMGTGWDEVTINTDYSESGKNLTLENVEIVDTDNTSNFKMNEGDVINFGSANYTKLYLKNENVLQGGNVTFDADSNYQYIHFKDTITFNSNEQIATTFQQGFDRIYFNSNGANKVNITDMKAELGVKDNLYWYSGSGDDKWIIENGGEGITSYYSNMGGGTDKMLIRGSWNGGYKARSVEKLYISDKQSMSTDETNLSYFGTSQIIMKSGSTMTYSYWAWNGENVQQYTKTFSSSQTVDGKTFTFVNDVDSSFGDF